MVVYLISKTVVANSISCSESEHANSYGTDISKCSSDSWGCCTAGANRCRDRTCIIGLRRRRSCSARGHHRCGRARGDRNCVCRVVGALDLKQRGLIENRSIVDRPNFDVILVAGRKSAGNIPPVFALTTMSVGYGDGLVVDTRLLITIRNYLLLMTSSNAAL
jgi:hypothetical protein